MREIDLLRHHHPARWTGPAEITVIDLDIDPIRYRADRRVEVEDEDEFAAHRVEFAHPEDVVAGALGGAAELREALTADDEPFATPTAPGSLLRLPVLPRSPSKLSEGSPNVTLMNDTALQSSPITLDRRVVFGEIDYQVTAFPTDDHRIDLCIVSSDADGHVVSEISGGIAPSDLTGLTDVLVSTLSGLIAMTQPPVPIRAAPPPDRPSRHPRRGARWTPEDDELLVARYRSGARPRELMDEFGRSNGGIRSRLEHLGELAPGGRWLQPPPGSPATTAAQPSPTPDDGPSADSQSALTTGPAPTT